MSNARDYRKPLAELQNVAPDNRAPVVKGPLKAGITKPPPLSATTNKRIQKKSGIPRAPTFLRRQTASAVPRSSNPDPEPENALPVPSRLAAAPKRSAAPRRGNTIAARPQFDVTRRRATASMSFTSGQNTRAPSIRTKSRNVAEEEANTLQEINSKQEQILAATKAAATVKEAVSAEELRNQFQSLSNRLDSNQNDRDEKIIKLMNDALEVKSQMLDAKTRQREAEFLLSQEKGKTAQLEEKLRELKENIASIEVEKADNEDGLQSVAGKVDELKAQLKDSEESYAVLLGENQKLKLEISAKRTAHDNLEVEANGLTSKLKELQRRLDVSESEVAAKDSDVRRIRREKENAESERDTLEDALRKKNAMLDEARATCQQLSTQVESLRASQGDMVKLAEQQVCQLKSDATARIAELEGQLTNSQRVAKTSTAELENRKQELTHMREAVALQESTMSRSNCEKLNLEAKISALHGDVALKSDEIAKMVKVNEEQRSVIAELEQQAREDAALRRKLHNAIQELKGNIRVFCRVRPMLPKELESSQRSTARQMFDYNEKGQGVVARPPTFDDSKPTMQRYPFKFDRVFGPDCKQDAVFEEISQLVQSALDGYRVCIFAYGQTGSGKTHTMLGNRGSNDDELGMIPRSVRQVFETAKQLEKDQWGFTLKASFLEIYNETVRDLLVNNNGSGSKSKGKDDKHRIVFNHEKKLSTVTDLTIEDVKSEEQVQRLIHKSMSNRSTAATQANERSSRSHSVFRLHIEGHNASTGQRLNGLLNLVDLAGSERLAHSKAEGDRLRETKHINKSLSSLGDVIAALANKDKHIPFRNSKLTYLLQDSLGGDCKTLMFVNLSHAAESFNESLCSLRFAAKVNSCHVGTARRSAKIEF